jgi:hypothetical protein
MSSAAERKAKQRALERAGRMVVPVEVNRENAITLLVVTGHLKERDMENITAISNAMSRFFADQAEHRRLQRMKAAIPLPIDKAKPTAVCYRTPSWREDTDMWVWREDREEIKAHWASLTPDKHPPEVSYVRRKGDNRPTEVSDLPLMRVAKKISGRNGKWIEYLRALSIFNIRGIKIGRYRSKPLPCDSGKKIKQLKYADIKKAEKEIEKEHGLLVEPDTSVHTLASLEGEVDRRLDEIEFEELGYAKRKSVPPRDEKEDD